MDKKFEDYSDDDNCLIDMINFFQEENKDINF